MNDRGTTEESCFCVGIALQSDGPPRRVVHCRCGQCRRLSGGAFTTWVSFRKTGWRVSSGEDSISAFDGADALTPTAHYFVDHKAAWFAIRDDLAQFGGESGIEPRESCR